MTFTVNDLLIVFLIGMIVGMFLNRNHRGGGGYYD